MKQLNQVHAFTDLNRFSEMRSKITNRDEGMAAEVAKEFEALFIEMMLASARKASINSGLFESHALELYREMFDTQAARILSEQGALGFEQQISQFLDQTVNAATPQQKLEQTHPDRGNAEQAHALSVPARRENLPVQQPIPAESSVPVGGWSRAHLFPETTEVTSTSADGKPSDHQRTFISRLAPFARKAAAELGTEPSILIAQAALETGWGRHVISGKDGTSSNNLFAIKANNAWSGRSAEVNTFEFFDNRPIKTKASFRAYASIDDAFQDYVSFIKDNPRYKQALTVAANPDGYIRELARAGYATDPRYAEKIIAIKQKISAEIPVAISATEYSHNNAENPPRAAH